METNPVQKAMEGLTPETKAAMDIIYLWRDMVIERTNEIVKEIEKRL